MKKLLLATLVAAFAGLTAQLYAGCCVQREVVRQEVRQDEACCEVQPPKCYKTVEVAAKKIVIPQPDICERIAQPAKCIRIPQPPIPQPDLIKYECQPDLVVYHKQCDIIRYECPCDATASY